MSEEAAHVEAEPRFESPADPAVALEATQVAPPELLPEAERGEDAFEGWPAAQSSAVIEELPAEVSVEHVRGEIDVPDGFIVLEGTPLGKRRSVGIVVSRFNGGRDEHGCSRAPSRRSRKPASPRTRSPFCRCPGAFELPLAAMALAKTRRYACIVALGAIVRGETPHFEYVVVRVRLRAPARRDRDRDTRLVRGPDGRHRRPGGGAHPQGGRGRALGAGDGRPVRAASCKRAPT